MGASISSRSEQHSIALGSLQIVRDDSECQEDCSDEEQDNNQKWTHMTEQTPIKYSRMKYYQMLDALNREQLREKALVGAAEISVISTPPRGVRLYSKEKLQSKVSISHVPYLDLSWRSDDSQPIIKRLSTNDPDVRNSCDSQVGSKGPRSASHGILKQRSPPNSHLNHNKVASNVPKNRGRWVRFNLGSNTAVHNQALKKNTNLGKQQRRRKFI